MDGQGYRTISLENVEIRKEVLEFQYEIEHADKNGYPHYMLKEIFEQPRTIADCFRGRILPEQGIVKLGGLASIDDRLRDFSRIVITACGTSWHAALVGEYTSSKNWPVSPSRSNMPRSSAIAIPSLARRPWFS